jgi:hypothetical protein
VTLPAIIQVEVAKARAELSACNANISSIEEEARVACHRAGFVKGSVAPEGDTCERRVRI